MLMERGQRKTRKRLSIEMNKKSSAFANFSDKIYFKTTKVLNNTKVLNI